MRAKRIILFSSAWIFVLAVGPAWAQFVPGHVFVSDPAQDFCFHGGTDLWDRIWEIDPETGEVTLFAQFFAEDCRFITGLVFTPDGCRLRASAMLTDEILEFAPDGTYAVALDADDGISAPSGSNNLAYDAERRFYVVNAGRYIMRFPADGGAGTILADRADGIRGSGPIAIAADGDLYFGNAGFERYVLRVTPERNAFLFDTYTTSNLPYTVTADDSGHVYVGLIGTPPGIYRYDAGDPQSKQLVTSSLVFTKVYAITVAPDQKRIYAGVFGKQLLSVDVRDGSITTLAQLTDATVPAGGIAVVPLLSGDLNRDRTVSIADYGLFSACVSGPASRGDGDLTLQCKRADLDSDGDIDIGDFALLQRAFGEALPACQYPEVYEVSQRRPILTSSLDVGYNHFDRGQRR